MQTIIEATVCIFLLWELALSSLWWFDEPCPVHSSARYRKEGQSGIVFPHPCPVLPAEGYWYLLSEERMSPPRRGSLLERCGCGRRVECGRRNQMFRHICIWTTYPPPPRIPVLNPPPCVLVPSIFTPLYLHTHSFMLCLFRVCAAWTGSASSVPLHEMSVVGYRELLPRRPSHSPPSRRPGVGRGDGVAALHCTL